MNKKFSDRLKIVRGDRSQKQFAAAINVHSNTLGRWERGDQLPNQEDLCSILSVSKNINPTWLLTGSGPQTINGVDTSGELSFSLLAQILEAIEEHLEESGLTLPPEKKARLACALYELVADKPEPKIERSVMLNLIKLAA